MHAYRWSNTGLLEELKKFPEGQFRLEIPNGPTFQGKFTECTTPDPKKRVLRIRFEWLAERRFTLGGSWEIKEYWSKLEIPTDQVMPVEFTYYYFQKEHWGIKGKPDRKKRIKLWTKMGEIGRFYQKNDPLILTEQDGRFLPTSPPVD